ncbi:unnamed protein product [Hymenolepis diminuta]|uniref:Uncharacterized protein n=1 Tax=Hymenolepis diminuta TaxID=6216 RepID=A0A564XYM6_HYMDI|nr:unnamed protein product [Hymenolepis diminuta]
MGGEYLHNTSPLGALVILPYATTIYTSSPTSSDSPSTTISQHVDDAVPVTHTSSPHGMWPGIVYAHTATGF